MTNNKPSLIEKARELLTCDELRGRVPDEVQALLRDIVALEPTAKMRITGHGPCEPDVDFHVLIDEYDRKYHNKVFSLYTLGAPMTPREDSGHES